MVVVVVVVVVVVRFPFSSGSLLYGNLRCKT